MEFLENIKLDNFQKKLIIINTYKIAFSIYSDIVSSDLNHIVKMQKIYHVSLLQDDIVVKTNIYNM